MANKRLKQKGATFLEVLAAVVVLSIGFLATSRMQIMGMRYNQSAFMMSQASIMAANIADRMRSNTQGVDDGDYDTVDTRSVPADPGCMNSGCTSNQLATLDIRQWGLALENALPNGYGRITRGTDIFEISVVWNEKIDEGATQEQTVTIWLDT